MKSASVLNSSVITNMQIKLNEVVRPLARPFTRFGMSSPISSQGTGPNPSEKVKMYTRSAMSGTEPKFSFVSSSKKKYLPGEERTRQSANRFG